MQYRDSNACEIMIINGGSIKRVTLVLDRNNLLEILQQVVKTTDQQFDFFVFDGVRQKIERCGDVLAFLNTALGKGEKGIHITSLQFSIKAGDGSYNTDQSMSVFSWEFSDYEAAFRSGLFTKNEWRSILLEDNESAMEQEKPEDTDAGKNDDEEMKDSEDETTGTSHQEESIVLLERKFYYAGGSARLMLGVTLTQLVSKILPDLLQKMSAQLWLDFSELHINLSSESTVNSLMQVLHSTNRMTTSGVVFPVSKYILHKAYERCRDKLVKAVKAAAELTANPAIKGWAFELAQIELINVAIESKHRVVMNASHNLVLPIHTASVTYNGLNFSGATDAACFVIKCIKWNEGCFDIAFFQNSKLVTIQFTVSRKHSVKLCSIRSLKEALEALGKKVDETVNHIAVVEGDVSLFSFDQPEVSSGTNAFTVALAKSTELLQSVQNGNLELKMGSLLASISCPERRSNKRQRKQVSRFTYS